MKKQTILSALFLFAASAISNSALASGLEVESCSIGVWMAHPINYVGCKIAGDGAITVADGAEALILCDGEQVASTRLTYDNYETSKRVYGKVHATFEEPLVLPKGKTYTFVLPKDAVMREADHTVTNDELKAEFLVPPTLGPMWTNPKEGEEVSRGYRMTFGFGLEISLDTTGDIILYREDVPVRAYPINPSWDWGIGHAFAKFNEGVQFEKGVHYTWVLPEGSVCARLRSDILNEEGRVNFVGGDTSASYSIYHSYSNIDEPITTDGLGEVKLYFDKQVALSLAPKVQLVAGGVNVEQEIVPTLVCEDGKWVLTADFGGVPISNVKRYSVVIPEATVVAPAGAVAVNRRTSVAVNQASGITAVEANECKVTVSNGTLSVSGLKSGADLRLYGIDGKLAHSLTVNEDDATFTFSTPGVYILTIDGKTRKVIL